MENTHMFHLPEIDPVAFAFGPVKIYWYGIMYLLAFAIAWMLSLSRTKKTGAILSTQSEVEDFIFYCALGVILGGRIGYVLLYDLSNSIANPLLIFKIWQGGMAFHGGLIGVATSLYLFAKKYKINILRLMDFAAPLAPIGIALGRVGNFINGELWGRITTVYWGVVYPHAGLEPRHPSELYEALGEGIILFIILWLYTKKPRPSGYPSAVFLIGYGLARFICEFFRQPDINLGFIAWNWLTMGQLLSLLMILAGCSVAWISHTFRNNAYHS